MKWCDDQFNLNDEFQAERCYEEDVTLDHLADPIPAPDLTNRIMDHLGYEKVSSAEKRNADRRKYAERGMIMFLFITIVCFGVYAHSMSNRARRVSGNNMNDATTNVVNDVSSFRNTLSNIFQPAVPLVPDENLYDESVESVHKIVVPNDSQESNQSRVAWSGLL